jgi:hypothetical protein
MSERRLCTRRRPDRRAQPRQLAGQTRPTQPVTHRRQRRRRRRRREDPAAPRADRHALEVARRASRWHSFSRKPSARSGARRREWSRFRDEAAPRAGTRAAGPCRTDALVAPAPRVGASVAGPRSGSLGAVHAGPAGRLPARLRWGLPEAGSVISPTGHNYPHFKGDFTFGLRHGACFERPAGRRPWSTPFCSSMTRPTS